MGARIGIIFQVRVGVQRKTRVCSGVGSELHFQVRFRVGFRVNEG